MSIEKPTPREIGESNANTAWDQRFEHDTSEDARSSYLQNAIDTVEDRSKPGNAKGVAQAIDAFIKGWESAKTWTRRNAHLKDTCDRCGLIEHLAPCSVGEDDPGREVMAKVALVLAAECARAKYYGNDTRNSYLAHLICEIADQVGAEFHVMVAGARKSVSVNTADDAVTFTVPKPARKERLDE
jgi:hypothetical protein